MIAALIAVIPAMAAWKEYPQPQLGFVVEFPSEPAASTGNYRTALVPSATAHVYAVKESGAGKTTATGAGSETKQRRKTGAK